jgi:dTDP-4-dehydrorhamnose 3,5-epimerase
MRFQALSIDGAVCVHVEARADGRGLFARTFCVEEFARAGLPTRFVQSSTSFNVRRGTVRGMHFQWPPSREAKLVRCVRGAIHDIMLDLRPESPTYLRHLAVVLDEDSRKAVFIPPGVGHGFQTLVDSSEVLYQMTDFYAPELASGYRWNDPTFGIEWPIGADVVISERDGTYGDFDSGEHALELARRT